jgi:hypothetical protein
MSVTALADHRAPDGRFAKGRSGNPAGRPKGARNQATVLAEQLEEAGPDLLARAVRRAFDGDAVTLRALLGHMLPRPGDRTVELDLPPGAETDDDAMFAATFRAVADGVISPADALRIGRLVALRAKIAERTLRLKLRMAREAGRSGKPAQTPRSAAPSPVSDLYSAAKTAPVPAASVPEAGSFPPALHPVSSLYFGANPASTSAFGRPPLAKSRLCSSTARCGAVPDARPAAAAAAGDAIRRLHPSARAAI